MSDSLLRRSWRRTRSVIGVVSALLLAQLATAQGTSPSLLPDLELARGDGAVSAIALQPDGGIVLAGAFDAINGVSRRHIARLRPDGQVDPAWDPSPDGTIRALAVDAGGAIYVAGSFGFIGGQSRSGIAKLSGSGSGAVDPDWRPPVNGTVYTLVVDTGGSVYAAGLFSEIGGQQRSNIAKLAGEGTGVVDPVWNPSADFVVMALALDHGGAIFAGGNFSSVGGQARSRIAKLSTSGTGAADPTWNPSANNNVEVLAVDANGAVYAGGDFTLIGGQSRSRVAKLSGTGTGAADSVWNPSPNTTVRALAVAADGGVFVGGNFTSIAGQPRNRIAKLSGSGTGVADPDWNPSMNESVGHLAVGPSGTVHVGGRFTAIDGHRRIGFGVVGGSGVLDAKVGNTYNKGSVEALARQPDGGLIVGGDFVSANGVQRKGILRLRPDGTLDPDWNPLAAYPFAPSRVMALAVDGTGAVYAGGSFSQIGGQARSSLAKLSAGGTGTADPAWNPAPNGAVYAVALGAHGEVYIGGNFLNVGGQMRRRLAKLSSTGIGAVDPEWDPAADNDVLALAVDAAGALYAGGMFANVGGRTRSRIAKLSGIGTGAADPDWSPSANNSVYTLAVDAGGSVYAGGIFTSIGGQSRNRVARLSAAGTGAADASWNPAANGSVHSLAVKPGGAVYVGGFFTNIGGQARSRIARLSGAGTGSVDPGWNPSADGSHVYALLVDSGDSVFVGGNFTTIGGARRGGLVRLVDRADAIFADGFE